MLKDTINFDASSIYFVRIKESIDLKLPYLKIRSFVRYLISVFIEKAPTNSLYGSYALFNQRKTGQSKLSFS